MVCTQLRALCMVCTQLTHFYFDLLRTINNCIHIAGNEDSTYVHKKQVNR